jgi:diguanylate cyclase (GGDEF)-like protein/PAS domain S-box-containing protein
MGVWGRKFRIWAGALQSRLRNVRTSTGHAAAELADILNSVPQVLWSASADGRLDFVSDQWERDYGGSPARLLDEGWLDFVHPDDRARTVATWTRALESKSHYQMEFRMRRPASGDYRWIIVSASPAFDDHGNIVRWYGSSADIHDRVTAQQTLAEEERLYRSVLEASADCIRIISADGRIEFMNGPGLALTEIGDISAIEGRFWWDFWPEDMRKILQESVSTARSGRTARFSGACPTASGVHKWWDVVVTPIPDSDGETRRILAISRDITVERQKSEELRWASEHDALTSLPNRRAFQARLQAAVIRSMRLETKVGLLLVDLDHFKHVNDTLGHSAGDAMLIEFAKRLRRAIPAEGCVARVGGDEFAIVLEGIESAEDLLIAGENVSLALNAPVKVHGRAVSGGASIGGALFPDDGDSANDLFKVADTALYALKAEGRGGTKLFHAHMREEAQRVASQLSLARVAVNERSVVPVYQPKIDLQTEAVVGFEALLRWEHPRRGLQPPESIEEAFKDYELAAKIGGLMHRKVFADMRQWIDLRLDFGRISINAAPAEFLRDDYAERLLERLAERSIAPSLLELEVTEHVLMANGSKYVRRALVKLKAAGVNIALDDFGTGHSSLSHLRDFPVDVVKIDKSFVQQMGRDAEIGAIVTAVVNLADSLDIASVAEGIETPEQKELLRLAGCDIGQGYLLGKPMAGDVVVSRLAKVAA